MIFRSLLLDDMCYPSENLIFHASKLNKYFQLDNNVSPQRHIDLIQRGYINIDSCSNMFVKDYTHYIHNSMFNSDKKLLAVYCKESRNDSKEVYKHVLTAQSSFEEIIGISNTDNPNYNGKRNIEIDDIVFDFFSVKIYLLTDYGFEEIISQEALVN